MTLKMIDKCASKKDQQKVRIVTQKERLMLQKKSDRRGKKKSEGEDPKERRDLEKLSFYGRQRKMQFSEGGGDDHLHQILKIYKKYDKD